MAPPAKRRRVENTTEHILKKKAPLVDLDVELPDTSVQNNIHGEYGEIVPKPAGSKQWQGFCEIENEPAFFNVMLKEFGVKGIKVQEVISLDDDTLALLPQPVYGLIFLFRYKSDDINKQESSCPDDVWFANQTHDFACATVSLLNIVNNVPGLDLGPHLQSFKEFTSGFPPALRGNEIGNFEFVKTIHNSFARDMDILNIDLAMCNEYDDRRRKAKPRKDHETNGDDDANDEAAFHFVAFLPIRDQVWMLDGLNRQPEKLGPIRHNDWLSIAKPYLEDKMATYMQGQIEFGLLSVCRDPLWTLRKRRLSLVDRIRTIQARLDMLKPDWMSFTNASFSAGHVLECDGSRPSRESDSKRSSSGTGIPSFDDISDTTELVGLQQQLISDFARVEAQVCEEQESVVEDERRARERQHDFGPMIYAWLNMLSRKGDDLLKEMIEATKN